MTDPFVHLDIGQLARDLELEVHAKEHAEADNPLSLSTNPGSIEREAVEQATKAYRRAEREATDQFQTYDERVASLGLLSNLSTIGVKATQADGEMSTAIMNVSNRLANAKTAISVSYDHLNAFQKQNGLTRPVRLSSPFMATIGAIILAWVFETIVNAFLLKQNDDLGLLGGIVAAATIGAINIGVAAFVGRQIWPKTNLRRSAARYIGWGVTVLWILFTLLWNLGAAHYRDAKVAGLSNPEAAALSMFGSPPETLYSWGLLFAGIIFSIIAALSAYRMDDPYPGYGAISRDHQTRCEDYATEVEDATDELTDIRDDAISLATEIRSELERQFTEKNRAQNARAAFAQRFRDFHKELESAGNQLLTIYRTVNSQGRASPPPAYFNDKFILPEPHIPDAPVVRIGENQIKDTEKALMTAVDHISTRYGDAIASFETLDHLKEGLGDE